MADWLPLREIERIYGDVKLGGTREEHAIARLAAGSFRLRPT
jgi:hypothetical protein